MTTTTNPFAALKKSVNATLTGRGSKSAARAGHSTEVQLRRALCVFEAINLGKQVVSTTFSPDAELDKLSGEEYTAAFNAAKLRLSKKEKFKAMEKVTVKVKAEDGTESEQEQEQEVEKIRLPYADLAAEGLSTELHGARFGQVKRTDPAYVVDRCITLLSRDWTPEAILEHAPKIPTMLPWANVREQLMSFAAQKKVAPAAVCKVFGLEDETTAVVPSEEFEAESSEAAEAKETAKASRKGARAGRRGKEETAA